MYYLKVALQKIYPPFFFKLLKFLQRSYFFAKNKGYSEEETIIYNYLNEFNIDSKYRFAVDIASQDGILGSQTLHLFKKKWNGIALEVDGYFFSVLASFYKNFSGVTLIKTKVTPFNILNILNVANCPQNFGFLSLDIDSFDYFILDEILKNYRPQLVCVEINENIPPPIKFTVKYDVDFNWDGLDSHFQGQSIEMVNELCLIHNYKIIELHYNNLFIIPIENEKYPSITPKEAFDSGYLYKSKRKKYFPWNRDMEEIFSLTIDNQIDFLNRKFSNYTDKYILKK
jgi:hypothetical protein